MNKNAANFTSGANTSEHANTSEQNWKSAMDGVRFDNGDESMNGVGFDNGGNSDEVQTAPKSEERPSTDTEVDLNVADEVSMNTGPSDHGPESDQKRQSPQPETAMDETAERTLAEVEATIEGCESKIRYLVEEYNLSRLDFNSRTISDKVAAIQEEIRKARDLNYKRHRVGMISGALEKAKGELLSIKDKITQDDSLTTRIYTLLEVANTKDDVVSYYHALGQITNIISDLKELKSRTGVLKWLYGLGKDFDKEGLEQRLDEECDKANRLYYKINGAFENCREMFRDDNNPSTSPQTPNANDSANSVPSTPHFRQ